MQDAPAGGSVRSDEVPEVSRVAVKVPPFWKANPKLWFRQLDSQFYNAGITSDVTKFHTLVGAIESEVLTHVSDIVCNPPAQNMYATLRARLEEQFTESEQIQLRKLLSDVELGDKRPTQLLREMRDLAAGRVGDDLLKTLWLQRLPTQVQAILSTSEDNLNKLATMADKISEITSLSHVNAVTASRSDPVQSISTSEPSTSVLQELRTEIERLSRRLDNLGQTRSRYRARSRSESRGPTHHDGVCILHHKYKDKARKCLLPCAYKSDPTPRPAENDLGRR